jgi:dienelactone hydrolase
MKTATYLLAATLLASSSGAAAQEESRVIGDVAGTGPYPAVAEVRPDAPQYTIYRPRDLPGRPMPVVVWGNGACRDNGLSVSHFLREIASHGYLVIANGTARLEQPPLYALPAEREVAPASGPPPAGRREPDETSVEGMLLALDWAVSTNAGQGDLGGHIDAEKIAVMGHSCGGLQALAAGADPRVDTVVAFASGVYNRPAGGLSGVAITKDDLRRLHTPVAYILGGPSDIAYPNGSDDFARIDHVPVMLANLPVGHGGTFRLTNGGDWARIGVAWLDWQLKGDPQAARWFVGTDCRLCTSYGWSVQRKQFPENP